MLDRSFEAPAPNRRWIADFTMSGPQRQGQRSDGELFSSLKTLDDRIFEPDGVRETAWIGLNGYQLNGRANCLRGRGQRHNRTAKTDHMAVPNDGKRGSTLPRQIVCRNHDLSEASFEAP